MKATPHHSANTVSIIILSIPFCIKSFLSFFFLKWEWDHGNDKFQTFEQAKTARCNLESAVVLDQTPPHTITQKQNSSISMKERS